MFKPFVGNIFRAGNDLDRWVALREEAPLEPGIAIVDAHQHFSHSDIGDHGIDRWIEHVRGNNVAATVHVECSHNHWASGPEAMRPVGETEHAVACARYAESRSTTTFCAGIVGLADLTLGAGVEPVLEAHAEAGGGRLRGIRHATAHDDVIGSRAYRNSPKGLMLEPGFREGFAVMAQAGLSFDAWVYLSQHDDVAYLARAFPETPIVVNHCGGLLGVGAYSQDFRETMAIWRRGLATLGACDNVVMKIGGLGMPATGSDLHLGDTPPSSERIAATWQDAVDSCIDAFGPSRCMLEANYPVDRQVGAYGTIWNAFKRATAGYSETEREHLFSRTASTVYRLA